MLFSRNVARNGILLSILEGKNCCITYHFRIKVGNVQMVYLRIDRNFCLVHEEITSIRLYTPCIPRSGLRKGVYSLI